MKRVLSVFILLYVSCTGAVGQRAYWQQDLHYTIDVSLIDSNHTLDGFLRLRYTNYSPDTLKFIWFHIWPNAFKSDRTAFSEQLLENGRTDFYFSNKEQKGFINRLDFRSDGRVLDVEDHPEHIDIVKVHLDQPLAPNDSVVINTPFHLQLPYTFSRMGYKDGRYAVTQWYPKPAVYDRNGWHPMPYLDQGEFYSEFATFDVRITLPEDFVVAATGELQNKEEISWLKMKKNAVQTPATETTQNLSQKTKFIQGRSKNKAVQQEVFARSTEPKPTKTLRYLQQNVHDFAWFADRNFIVDVDSVQLLSGRRVDVFAFYDKKSEVWAKAAGYAKEAILFRSQEIGEYPYNTVSVVEGRNASEGGMEYPTITLVSGVSEPKLLDFVIEHEIGHNWFYGILASNERKHPWMDEGMNTFYDLRYMKLRYGTRNLVLDDFKSSKMPADEFSFLLDWMYKLRIDQPVSSPSVEFSTLNYSLIAYAKAAIWLEKLEEKIGRQLLDSSMRTYYRQWSFKHPDPSDFRSTVERVAGAGLEEHFNKLDERGPLEITHHSSRIKPSFGFNLGGADSVHFVNFLPVIGYNVYDKFMIGAAIHNYTLPPRSFRFFIAPLYATGSGKLNGTGLVSYNLFSYGKIRKAVFELGGASFSSRHGVDSNGVDVFGRWQKLVPAIRLVFRNRSARSTRQNTVEWKTFLIRERGFSYALDSGDSLYYPYASKFSSRAVNQLTFTTQDYRKLYPYDLSLQVQQGKNFYRFNFNGNYFFNYANGGGLNVRLFAAKFGYLGSVTGAGYFETYNYQPKLTAVRGYEDYTYSNYFIGRNESEGLASRQIMLRDGGLKLRTDLFQGLQGRSDNWISSINLNTTLPPKLFPIKLPIRLFLDIGTYAEAWSKEAPTSKFLYVGGLQVSLFKDLLNIYAPLIYSKEFRDSFKSVPDQDGFFKRISFSIDLHRFDLRKIAGNEIPL